MHTHGGCSHGERGVGKNGLRLLMKFSFNVTSVMHRHTMRELTAQGRNVLTHSMFSLSFWITLSFFCEIGFIVLFFPDSKNTMWLHRKQLLLFSQLVPAEVRHEVGWYSQFCLSLKSWIPGMSIVSFSSFWFQRLSGFFFKPWAESKFIVILKWILKHFTLRHSSVLVRMPPRSSESAHLLECGAFSPSPMIFQLRPIGTPMGGSP